MSITQQLIWSVGFVELMIPSANERLDEKECDEDCTKDDMALGIVVDLGQETLVT